MEFKALENQLQEAQRDALVDYLLGQVMRKDQQLGQRIKTADDLYEYLLIDPLVSSQVTTSAVAEAIASLQQYVNRIVQRREPGLSITAQELKQWQAGRDRYALWATDRQLAVYPENSLDPTLRAGKSALFAALEENLQQGRLTEATVHKAVLGYLNEFEAISNLKILTAYLDGTDCTRDTVYILGRTRSSPSTYYWRSLDLSRRTPTTGSSVSSADKPTADAWTDWRKIDLPLGNAAHDQAVRPVVLGNRLYVAWYEATPRRGEGGKETGVDTKVQLAFRKFDDSWTIAHTVTVDDFDPRHLVALASRQLDGADCLYLCGYETTDPRGNTAGTRWLGIKFDMLLNVSPVSQSERGCVMPYVVSSTGAFAPYLVQQAAKQGQWKSDLCGLVHEPADPAIGSIRYLYTTDKRDFMLATRFAQPLIQRANAGLDQLLDWSTQGLTEPPYKPGAAAEKIDFDGPYGKYFWELFFHLPWLVAHRCNREHRFGEARRWLHRIFTPQRHDGRYWQVRPLVEMGQGSAARRMQAAPDPHEIATVAPVHYRKAIFFAYVKNLLDLGDAKYRELSRDGLGEAKGWYMMARDLLGRRPDTAAARRWRPLTLAEAAQGRNQALRLAASRTHLAGLRPRETSAVPDPALAALDTGVFSVPRNTQLLQYWQAVDTRLDHLRRHLTLDGKPLTLSLFEAPVDAAELLGQRGRGAGVGRGSALMPLAVPPFRFALMMSKASSGVDALIQFGNALQIALERKDSAYLERLQHTQQKELLTFTLEMQRQTIEMGNSTLAALQTGETGALHRQDHYRRLVDENISDSEIAAMALRGASGAVSAAGSMAFAVGNLLDLLPNTFGLANGGMRWGGAGYAVGNTLFGSSTILASAAGVLETTEQFRRRREEWLLQVHQAEFDTQQIRAQITAQRQQNEVYQKQLVQLQAQQAQMQTTLGFLSSRFTSEALYQWLVGQLSALYFQAYDAVSALCMATEAAWRYETGQFGAPSFIQAGAWNDLYCGLLAGEKLKLGLQRMDQAYLTRHERKLEIVHTVSLKQWITEHLGEAKWQAMLAELRAKGRLMFSFAERDFAERYPGHFLRQIHDVSVSLPAVVGPYQDVCATLTQTGSAFSTAADIEAVKYLIDRQHGSAGHVKSNLRAAQQVALSSGFDDGGLFVLNFGDERYLPFEGTGAVSHWELTFPNPTRAEQAGLLANLTDVIVRLRYTARDGGTAFARQVEGILKPGALA